MKVVFCVCVSVLKRRSRKNKYTEKNKKERKRKDGNRIVFDPTNQLGTKSKQSNVKTGQNYEKGFLFAKFNCVT